MNQSSTLEPNHLGFTCALLYSYCVTLGSLLSVLICKMGLIKVPT